MVRLLKNISGPGGCVRAGGDKFAGGETGLGPTSVGGVTLPPGARERNVYGGLAWSLSLGKGKGQRAVSEFLRGRTFDSNG